MSAMIICFGILQRILIQRGNQMSWIKSGQNSSSGIVLYLTRAEVFSQIFDCIASNTSVNFPWCFLTKGFLLGLMLCL